MAGCKLKPINKQKQIKIENLSAFFCKKEPQKNSVEFYSIIVASSCSRDGDSVVDVVCLFLFIFFRE